MMMITPINKPMNCAVWVGKVPAVTGTFGFVAAGHIVHAIAEAEGVFE